jgi:hypothetical protein
MTSPHRISLTNTKSYSSIVQKITLLCTSPCCHTKRCVFVFAGGEVTAEILWVSSSVKDRSVCLCLCASAMCVCVCVCECVCMNERASEWEIESVCGEGGWWCKRHNHRTSIDLGITWSDRFDWLTWRCELTFGEDALGQLHHVSPSISGATSHGPLGTFIRSSLHELYNYKSTHTDTTVSSHQ